MFNQLRKYRIAFAIGLLAFYMVGGMHFSILECLHFLSHVDDLMVGKYQKHDLRSHDDSHTHTALTAMDNQSENDPNDKMPVSETSDLSVKKSPQLFCLSQIQLSIFIEKTPSLFAFSNRLNGLHPSVPFPPPKV